MKPWTRTYRPGSAAECRAIVHSLYNAAGGAPMIDLGCRSAPLTRDLAGTWVDLEPQPDSPPGTVVMDLMHAAREMTGFHLVILTDVLEHLGPEDGRWLIGEGIERLGTACVLFTPVGPFCVSDLAAARAGGTYTPHAHYSAWAPETLWQEGWQIWEWPTFHRFPDGSIHGAFFAWTSCVPELPMPTAEDLAMLSGVPI